MTDETTSDNDKSNGGSGGNGGVTLDRIEAAKAKFEEYEQICEDEIQLDEEMAQLRAKKSEAVKAIEDLIGKGPFKYKEEELIITKRGDTYYFRGKGKSNVTVIA